jgi:drug/metabolite transporter (DMT)-like permease
VTFLLNFTPLFVLVLGVIILDEKPSISQLFGILIVFVGAYLFFSDQISRPNILGVLITLFSGLGWASYMVFGRYALFSQKADLLNITAFSMSIGTFILWIFTYTFEGISTIPLQGWIILLWLGIVNTAAAFFLWNYALLKLKALETAVIQNTMLIQIALMSWIFLGETLGLVKLIAIFLVLFGVIIVQLKNKNG